MSLSSETRKSGQSKFSASMSITENRSYDLKRSPDSLDCVAFVRKCLCKERLWPEICGLRGDGDTDIPRSTSTIRAADLRTFPRLVESPKCRVRQ